MRTLNVIVRAMAAGILAHCAPEDTTQPAARNGNAAMNAAGSEASVLIPTTAIQKTPPLAPRLVTKSDLPPMAAVGADGQCGAVMQTAQNTLQPVDVIFSIDTSGTMRDEIKVVKENMNAFSQQIRASGVDVHVILIASEYTGMDDPFGGLLFTDGLCIAAPLGSGMCPMDSNPPSYAHVLETIGQWNILDAYILHYPDYKQYLRDNSVKTFVSVSDADASTGADKFMSDVQALDPKLWSNWRYSAIYPFTPCGDGGEFGSVHADLVKRTQGVAGDLCQQNFAPVFDEIAQKLVEVVQLSCDWAVPAPPQGETFDAGKTNVRLEVEGKSEDLLKSPSAADCGDREGWHYDDETNPTRVVACPATCSRIQSAARAQVNVLFGCETQIIPI